MFCIYRLLPSVGLHAGRAKASLMLYDAKQTSAWTLRKRIDLLARYTLTCYLRLSTSKTLIINPEDQECNPPLREQCLASEKNCQMMIEPCSGPQGIWTDGISLISTGLDQSLNSWLIQLVMAATQASGASQQMQESPETADHGTMNQSASGEPHGSQGCLPAALEGNCVETSANKHDHGDHAAYTCSISLSRTAKQQLQVLEPSSLAILSTFELPADPIAILAMVVGRGTQVLWQW